MTQTMLSSSGSSRIKKGAANVVTDWSDGLQQPSGLKCPRARL